MMKSGGGMASWPQSMMQPKMTPHKVNSYTCLWDTAHTLPHHHPPFASSPRAPALLSCTCGDGGDGDSPAERHRAHTQHSDPRRRQGIADTGTFPKHRGLREWKQVVKCKILCCCQVQPPFSCFPYLLLLYTPWSQMVHLQRNRW